MELGRSRWTQKWCRWNEEKKRRSVYNWKKKRKVKRRIGTGRGEIEVTIVKERRVNESQWNICNQKSNWESTVGKEDGEREDEVGIVDKDCQLREEIWKKRPKPAIKLHVVENKNALMGIICKEDEERTDCWDIGVSSRRWKEAKISIDKERGVRMMESED